MIFVTGSDGFVGSELIDELRKRNLRFRAGVRNSSDPAKISYGELANQNEWPKLLEGVTSIVHLAARVHVMNEKEADPLTAFREVNVKGSLNLAKAARAIGVKRFIYVSSIKVNGEQTYNEPFKHNDQPHVTDPYGISKYEAEVELLKLHEPGVFEIVIIRPPLVYGKQVKANFNLLFKLVAMGLPLPFASVANKRSFVSVLNLVDLIIICIAHPKAGGRTFLVSDDNDMSLPELLLTIGKVKNKKVKLFPFSIKILELLLMLIGKKAFSSRLFGNLQVDISNTKLMLEWKPKYNFENTFSA